MSRERQFDHREVLESVTDLFLVHGYQGTSLAMLQEATGLGKQSLYNAYGDKRSTYLQALDCAAERHASGCAAMAAAASGRAALELYFEALVRHCSSAELAERTCMVTAGLLEGLADELVQQRLQAKFMATHELLRTHVERGQRDGSIRNVAPSAELADWLLNLTTGLRVHARAGLAPERLHKLVDKGLALLDVN